MKKPLQCLIIASLLLLWACDDFFERDISDMSVEITAPSDKATVTDGEVAFNWDAVEGAARYRFVIATPSINDALSVVCDVLIVPDSAAVSCTRTEVLAEGTYQWYVQGINSAGATRKATRDLYVVGSVSDFQ